MTYQFRLREEPFEFYSEFDNAEESLTTDFAGTRQGEVSRKSSDYIRWVQESLNKILGLRLAVDGVIGPQTRSTIRSFQRQKRLRVDGEVGAQTEAALIAAGTNPLPGNARHSMGGLEFEGPKPVPRPACRARSAQQPQMAVVRPPQRPAGRGDAVAGRVLQDPQFG